MARFPKPVSFYQRVNLRSMKNGKHRRPSPPAHSDSNDGTDSGNAGAPALYITTTASATVFTILTGPEPEPPKIPHAGIRAGEIIGHRLWWIRGLPHCCNSNSIRLYSIANDKYMWEPGQIVTGDTNRIVSDPNDPPIYGGVYAFTRHTRAIGELAYMVTHYKNSPIALGTVKMWGDVIEHEHGWRAEFAKIDSIDLVWDGTRHSLIMAIELRKVYLG